MKSNDYFDWFRIAVGRALVIKERFCVIRAGAVMDNTSLIEGSFGLVDILHDRGMHKIAHYLDDLTCELHEKAQEQLINNGA
ncbi:hypothetical protein [Pseudoalteromonas aurantia]|uniref:Uncharacterized protein n=1 Tax=Pseudoalteromonas aurantia TaxID=43654 RepID=A0A5S3V1R8_9GAMM|nr:hypothetical protein [Pseudoalteromonas aurantia]TMO64592.1 hypothetical protein CWC19_18255 [Pseudoalteromonas aurantia]